MEIPGEIILLFIIAVFALAFLAGRIEKAYNKRKPRIKTRAIVRNINDKYSSHIVWGRMGGYNHNPIYTVRFQLENGKYKTLSCPSPEYEWVKVGDIGLLAYQGIGFISFEKERSV